MSNHILISGDKRLLSLVKRIVFTRALQAWFLAVLLTFLSSHDAEPEIHHAEYNEWFYRL